MEAMVCGSVPNPPWESGFVLESTAASLPVGDAIQSHVAVAGLGRLATKGVPLTNFSIPRIGVSRFRSKALETR